LERLVAEYALVYDVVSLTEELSLVFWIWEE
jgi:hypothetical protein